MTLEEQTEGVNKISGDMAKCDNSGWIVEYGHLDTRCISVDVGVLPVMSTQICKTFNGTGFNLISMLSYRYMIGGVF